MVDTITIVLNKADYKVHKPEIFNPSYQPTNEMKTSEIEELITKHKNHRTFKLHKKAVNTYDQEIFPVIRIEEGIYLNNYYNNMHLTFSAPKLLFGENFTEINESSIDELIATLLQKLNQCSIETTVEAIKGASVSKIHFSKNIEFTSSRDANRFLNKMKKIHLEARYENHSRIYGNNGKCVRFHSNSFELIFYSKYYNLIQKKAYSTDRNKTPKEYMIAEQLKTKFNGIPPIIRMEVRMNTKSSISSRLSTITNIHKKDWNFTEVFSDEISKKSLQYYWNQLVSQSPNIAILSSITKEDMLEFLESEISFTNFREFFENIGIATYVYLTDVSTVRNLIYGCSSNKNVANVNWGRSKRKLMALIENLPKLDKVLIETVNKALLT